MDTTRLMEHVRGGKIEATRTTDEETIRLVKALKALRNR